MWQSSNYYINISKEHGRQHFFCFFCGSQHVEACYNLGRIFLHQLSSHLESHLNCYFFLNLMSNFLNVNCCYLVILFNEIKVSAGIKACFATVKYSIYCLKTPKKRQMTFKKFDIRCQKK
jgi:hypothetical protein